MQLASPPKGSLGSLVETVALCAGSGGSVLSDQPADLYWTGEMSHVTKFLYPFLLTMLTSPCAYFIA